MPGIYREGHRSVLRYGTDSGLTLRLITAPTSFDCEDQWTNEFSETTANNYDPIPVVASYSYDGCSLLLDLTDEENNQVFEWLALGDGDGDPETIVAAVVTSEGNSETTAWLWFDFQDFVADGSVCIFRLTSSEIDLCIPVGEVLSGCDIPEE